MIVLGIESSCDETALAVVKDGQTILASVVASQYDFHRVFGGVVPEIASRQHIHALLPLLEDVLSQSKLTMADVDGISVTRGPGLIGALLVGVCFAKALAYRWQKPLVGIHHIEGHLAVAFMQQQVCYPVLGLVVSGGHTSLYLTKTPGDYTLLGQTRDDAAGEAFDKTASLLHLGFPGGPALESAAKRGDSAAIGFPRARVPGYDFSFSGLKTAVAQWVLKHPDLTQQAVANIAASFQQSVVDSLIDKTFQAAKTAGANSVALCGGVASNMALRQRFLQQAHLQNLPAYVPPRELCTDNAVMPAVVGLVKLSQGLDETKTLSAQANIPMTA